MTKILVLHGVNLNYLGKREPLVYGSVTLENLNLTLQKQAKGNNVSLTCLQSNSESEFINALYTAADEAVDYLIINPGAWTHTSIALRDALLAIEIKFVEVHISNIYARELFRQHSYLSDIAMGVVIGFGINSYSLALKAILESN